jgi:hypothetical protein
MYSWLILNSGFGEISVIPEKRLLILEKLVLNQENGGSILEKTLSIPEMFISKKTDPKMKTFESAILQFL